jgi:muramoyltetrapeptide carboxypeptidase
MGKGIDPFTEKHFWGQIFSEESSYRLSFDECGGKLLYPGRAEGHLLGGCLSMVTGLLGTPYFPDFSGAVLFLEDVGEKPYKIDRYLAQLAQAGVFKKISGLILGTFDDCQAEPGEISFSLPEIFMDYFGGAGIPVITDFPYGHIPRKVTMPIGSTARIDTDLGTISFTNIFRMER